MTEMYRLLKAFDQWDQAARSGSGRLAERKERFATTSDLEIKRLYTPLDAPAREYLEKLGFPGEYPFTRGIQPSMYRGRFWTMRQYSGMGTAEESNRRYKYLLAEGQTGLSVAFDLPTQLGYDSDDRLAEGETGRVGVAIDSLKDMEILFDGIPLDKASTSMTINAPTIVILAMYIAVAEQQGVSQKDLSGTVQNDILKEYVARGTYIFPPQPSMKLVTDVFSYCSQNMPKWNTISIGAYHIREAGATAAQEVAFAFANANAYIEKALEAGLDIDAFAPRISWIFSTAGNFFEEIAKYRAARRIWARLLRERFKAKDPRSWMLRIHIQNGGSSYTAQQPLNNIIRGTVHCLASVLGGTQSLAICSYDEAHALPTEEAVRLSLRTQQIIAHESGVGDTVDPLGGSYYVESLTDQLEEEINGYIRKIDEAGGAVRAIESGYMQGEVSRAAYEYQKRIESGQEIVVGLNAYQVEEERNIELQRYNPDVRKIQAARLAELRAERGSLRVDQTLRALKSAAIRGENLMPAVLESVKSFASLGEICGVLREVYGEYQLG